MKAAKETIALATFEETSVLLCDLRFVGVTKLGHNSNINGQKSHTHSW